MENHVQRGCTIQFTAGEALKSGDLIILGVTPAVVINDTADTAEGVAETEGVFRVPKVAGALMAQGTSVSYVTADKAVQTAAPNAGLGFTGIGTVWTAAIAADTEVLIKLSTKHAVAAA